MQATLKKMRNYEKCLPASPLKTSTSGPGLRRVKEPAQHEPTSADPRRQRNKLGTGGL